MRWLTAVSAVKYMRCRYSARQFTKVTFPVVSTKMAQKLHQQLSG